MVTVGLVAVDGMKMGCPPALAANRGGKHIAARSPRPRTRPLRCERQRRAVWLFAKRSAAGMSALLTRIEHVYEIAADSPARPGDDTDDLEGAEGPTMPGWSA
jgi:hypothetical protein